MSEVRQLDIRSTQKLVLMLLADNANDEGTHCFPSIRRLAHEVGCSTRTIITIIRELEAIGVVKTLSKGNQYKPTQYYIKPSAGNKLQKFNPSGWAIPSECEVISPSPEVNVKSEKVNVKFTTSECEVPNNITISNHQETPLYNNKNKPAIAAKAALSSIETIPAKKFYIDPDTGASCYR
jgi:DNA-binding Lrp family transcriptional regulator